jgi:uncharacterized RDD family membrane protein YckC
VSLFYEALLLTAILFISTWVFLFLIQGLDSTLTRFLLQLYMIAVIAAYFVYCWTHGGQTLPMKTWRLRLVGREGNPVSRRVALQRYFFALLGFGLAGITIVWALFDRERQFLHDRLAGTRIVKMQD